MSLTEEVIQGISLLLSVSHLNAPFTKARAIGLIQGEPERANLHSTSFSSDLLGVVADMGNRRKGKRGEASRKFYN